MSCVDNDVINCAGHRFVPPKKNLAWRPLCAKAVELVLSRSGQPRLYLIGC